MKALLICPSERLGVLALTEMAPLSSVPILGKPLVEHWLGHLARAGATQVSVLAVDRPEQVRRVVGDGAKWGLKVEVIPEMSELSVAQARAKYRRARAGEWLAEPNDVVAMDALPWEPEHRLFGSYGEFFQAVSAAIPKAVTPDRIGVREARPGIWLGRRTRIAPDAQLQPPCWLGEQVWIGPGSVIGPQAVLEDRVYVEKGAQIRRSIVGPDTFVGSLTQLHDALAWGNTLIHWPDESILRVPDRYVLSSLTWRTAGKRTSVTARLAALLVMVATAPWGAAAMLRSKCRGRPVLRRAMAVPAQADRCWREGRQLTYYELENARGWLRRWPQLWNVVRGEFAWVGNRPLNLVQVEQLANDFERLWLSAPIGLFSLADAMDCVDAFNDDARAHSSFYAVAANARLDRSILWRAFMALNRNPSEDNERDMSPPLVPASLAKAEK